MTLAFGFLMLGALGALYVGVVLLWTGRQLRRIKAAIDAQDWAGVWLLQQDYRRWCARYAPYLVPRG